MSFIVIATLLQNAWRGIHKKRILAAFDLSLILLMALVPIWAIPWDGIVNPVDLHHPWFPSTVLRKWLFLWHGENQGVVNTVIHPIELTIHVVAVTLDSLGVSGSMINRLFLVLPLFLLGIATRHLCYSLLPPNGIRRKSIAATFLVIFSPISVINLSIGGALAYGLPAAFAILSLSYFIRAVREQRLSHLYLASTMTLLAVGLIQQVLLAFGAMLVYCLIDGLQRKRTIRNYFFFLLVLVQFAFLNAWWLLPFVRETLVGLYGYYNIDPLESVKLYTTWNTMLRTFLLRNSMPGVPVPVLWMLPNVVIGSIILTILSLLPLIINKTRKSIPVLWASSNLIFLLLLANGGKQPLGAVYLFLFRYMPFFIIFRTLEKFSVFIALFYAILASISINHVWEFIKKKITSRSRVLASISFVILVVILGSVASFPLISGDLSGGLRAYKLPPYYSKVRSYMQAQKQTLNLLLLPFSYHMSKLSWTPGDLNHMENPAYRSLFEQPTLYAESEISAPLNSPTRAVWDVLQGQVGAGGRGALPTLLKVTNAGFILVHNDKASGGRGGITESLLVKQLPLMGVIKETLRQIDSVQLVQRFGFLDLYEAHAGQDSTLLVPGGAVTIVGNNTPEDVIRLVKTPYFDPLAPAFASQQVQSTSRSRGEVLSTLVDQTQSVLFYQKGLTDLALGLLDARWRYKLARDQSSITISAWDEGERAYALFARAQSGQGTLTYFTRNPSDKDISTLVPHIEGAAFGSTSPTDLLAESLSSEWHYFGNVLLSPGQHKLTLLRQGTVLTEPGDEVDEIVAVPLPVMEETIDRTLELLQDPNKRVSYLFASDASRSDVSQAKALYLPQEANYVLQARVIPKIYTHNVYLLSEHGDWQQESSNWEWEVVNDYDQPSTIPPFSLYGFDWHPKGIDYPPNGRWGASDTVQIMLFNPNVHSWQGNLTFRITTVRERDLQVALNEQSVQAVHLPANYDQISPSFVDIMRQLVSDRYSYSHTPRYPMEWTEVTLDNVTLTPGENDLVFYTSRGTDKMDDLLGNDDNRQISIWLWDNIEFESQNSLTVNHRGEDSDFNNTQYETQIIDGQLVLDMQLDGDTNEQEYILMSRKFDSVDLRQYPLFNLQYTVTNPAVVTMDAAFGIDYTNDGQVDGYVIAPTTPTEDGSGQQIALDLFAAAKERFPDPYYMERRDLKLVRLYLIPHKQWSTDIKNTGRSGRYTFHFGAFNLYNERSIMVPDYTQTPNGYKELPYPENMPQSEEQRAIVTALFDEPLVKLDGQPILFQSPITQANLLDQNGYWLEPVTITLAAGLHNLEILTHNTFQVDLVEISNKPYEPESPAAEITFHKLNPTRYNVEVDTRENYWLVLSQNFHPDWKAYILEDDSASSNAWYEWSALLTWLMERDRRTEITDHYLVNAYANGWYVPKTGKYTITLEYTPQRMLEIGGIISGTTLLVCVGYLVWDWKRRRWE